MALIILVALIVVVGVLHLIAPKTFVINREIIINKPKDYVFNQIKMVKQHQAWNPWSKLDPKIVYKDSGVDGTVGFISAWEGDSKVGAGEQEIKGIIEGNRIDLELRFKRPMAATNQAYMSTEAVGENQTKVRWGMSGEYKFPGTVICYLLKMNKKLENDFDSGLLELKRILEKN